MRWRSSAELIRPALGELTRNHNVSIDDLFWLSVPRALGSVADKWLPQRKVNYRKLTTIAHYPTGASKWNPIEHRLFSEISKNWAAEPLDIAGKEF